MVDETFNSLVSSQPKSSSHLLPPPMLKPGQSGIADSIVFLPVTSPVDTRLSALRAETINHVDVEAMNSGLLARLLTSHTSGLTPSIHTTAPVVIPTVFNELLVPEETDDGLHYSIKIVKKQAEILLGYRCNDVASTMSGACCRRDEKLTVVQVIVLFFVCAWAPLSIFLRSRATSRSNGNGIRCEIKGLMRSVWNPAFAAKNNHLLVPVKAAMPFTIFGTAIFYLFLADRTSVFLKEQKQYSVWTFTILVLIALGIGLITMVRRDKDMGFLNREQTDEWKGWMQSRS